MPKLANTILGVALLIAFSPFAVGPACAQSQLDHIGAASLASRLGVSTARLWLDHDGIDIPPSNLPTNEQHAKIEQALKYYEAVRDGYAGVSTATTGTQITVSGVIGGAILYGGPQASVTVPLTLLAAASYVSLDIANAKVDQIGNERATSLLAHMADDLVKAAGVTNFTALADDPVLLRDTIIQSERFLQDVRRRARESGDPSLINMAADALQRVSAVTDVATLESLAQVAGNVSDLDAEFGEFVQAVHRSNERINDRLDEHEVLLYNIGEKLVSLDKGIAAVDEQVQRLGRNQDLVVDFMFSGLPPNQKASALRSGLMDDRIRCPEEDTSGCDRAKVKATMIEHYETEAIVMQNVAIAGEILQGINDIQTIVGDLGLDIGEDGNRALQIAGGAANAYIGFMSGNYLGVVASITGMFGNKPDPDEERFRIMMNYFRDQVGIINDKLDDVLENQQTILNAVVSVSKQLQLTYENLDGRLGRMEWEQRRISDNLKVLIWAEWRSCHSMYLYALSPNSAEGDRPFVNPHTLAFNSFEDVRAVINLRGDAALKCLSTMRASMVTLTDQRWFGAFLNAHRALDTDSVVDQGTLTDEAEQAERWRTVEQRHLEDVVAPATLIAFSWAKRNKVSASTLLNLQISRIANAFQLSSTIDAINNGNHFECNSSEETGRATRDLVCIPDRHSDTIAAELMSFAINADIPLQIANWMAILSPIADLYNNNVLPSFATTLEELATFPNPSHGEEVTRKTIDMLALAIAYYSRIYGGITALALAEDILSGIVHETHRTAIRGNPYLAENAALVLLHLKCKTWNLEAGSSRPSFELIYAQALVHARSEVANRFEPLYALFGRDHNFAVNDEDKVGLEVVIGEASILLPLPPPIRLSKGQFVFPPRYNLLIARQNHFVDAYVGYRLGRDTSLAIVTLQR